MAYMNTSVTRGRGEMLVTATGMDTEIGHIADLLSKTEADKTPLQKQLDSLSKIIAAIAGAALVLVVILGLVRGESFDTLFITGVALAVAAIPTSPGRGHRAAVDRHPRDRPAQRGRQAPAGGGDPGLDLGDLLGQDRHPDTEQDDRPGAGHPGRHRFTSPGRATRPRGRSSTSAG